MESVTTYKYLSWLVGFLRKPKRLVLIMKKGVVYTLAIAVRETEVSSHQSPMSSTIIKLAAEKRCLTEGREFGGKRIHLSKTIFYFFIFSSYFSDCNVIISFFSFLSSLQFPSYILPCF